MNIYHQNCPLIFHQGQPLSSRHSPAVVSIHPAFQENIGTSPCTNLAYLFVGSVCLDKKKPSVLSNTITFYKTISQKYDGDLGRLTHA